MMLRSATLFSILGLASFSQAAECYAQSGGNHCIAKQALLNQAGPWCDAHWNNPTCNWLTIEGPGGAAQAGTVGRFGSRDQCRSAFSDIVNSCHGHRDGGTWTIGGGITLTIEFCAR